MNPIKPIVSAFILLAATAWAQEPAGPEVDWSDPLEKVGAYSLEITGEGLPTANYFPIGLRGGGTPPAIVRLVTHCGFNLWQDAGLVIPENKNEPLAHKRPLDDEAAFRHGMFGFTQAKSTGLPLLEGKKFKGDLPQEFPNYGLMTPGLNEAGKPLTSNIFNAAWRKYHMDKKETTGEKIGGAYPVGRPTLFWGLENEWEKHLSFAPEAKEAFRVWLEKTYNGKVGELNEAWAGSYSTFKEAAAAAPLTAEYSTRPGAFLDWRTFCMESFTDFLSESAHILHESDPYKRPVVHKATQQTIDMPIANREKGTFSHERFADLMRDISGGLYGVNAYGTGDRQNYEINYIYHCIQPVGGGNYGVMTPEMNNHNGPGYTWAASYWRVLANGLKATNYFCTGYKGAKGDYATFGHIDAETGEPKDKLFYAARWAHMIHRTEALWKNSHPVAGLPKVAILLPKRDVELAGTPAQNSSKWASPENNRSNVFRWLRQLGYWVDVIPYNKLDKKYMEQYQGLFLVGAEHLQQDEVASIKTYVENGGVVVADERPGYYDEHHRIRRQLDEMLGVKFGDWDRTKVYDLGGEFGGLQAKGLVTVEARDASVIEKSRSGKPLVVLRDVGKGKVLYIALQLGSLWSASDMSAVQSNYTPENDNTADTGENFVEGAVSKFRESLWLGSLLSRAGLKPAYTMEGKNQPRLRLEQPIGDGSGNLLMVYSTDASRRIEGVSTVFPETKVEVTIPGGGDWIHCLYGSAEDAGLKTLKIEPAGPNRYRFSLPTLETAGVIYLFKNYGPLLGIPQIQGTGRSVDGHAARVTPGRAFEVTVQLANPGTKKLAAGQLKLAALKGWRVEPAQVSSEPLNPAEIKDYVFRVTAPENVTVSSSPDLPPLVARWNDGKQDRAICSVNVEMIQQKSPQAKADQKSGGMSN